MKSLLRKIRAIFCLLPLFFCVCFDVPNDCLEGFPCGNYTLTLIAETGGTVTPSGEQSAAMAVCFT